MALESASLHFNISSGAPKYFMGRCHLSGIPTKKGAKLNGYEYLFVHRSVCSCVCCYS